MGNTYDRLRQAEATRQSRAATLRSPGPRSYQIVTIANNKGGVGKTTLALNLAVYLRALREDWPVLMMSLDDQDGIDRALSLGDRHHRVDILQAAQDRRLDRSICQGQFGIQYVPAARDLDALAAAWPGEDGLEVLLRSSGFEGLVIVDTKSDLGLITRSALAASDLVLIPVKDLGSLREAERLFELFTKWGRSPEGARVLLSLIDLRVKFKADGETTDILALLLAELGARRWPHFPTFISRSPSVEALANHPDGRPRTVLHAAQRSLVHRQLHSLAEELIREIEAMIAARGVAQATNRRNSLPLANERPSTARGIARWVLGRGDKQGP